MNYNREINLLEALFLGIPYKPIKPEYKTTEQKFATIFLIDLIPLNNFEIITSMV